MKIAHGKVLLMLSSIEITNNSYKVKEYLE